MLIFGRDQPELPRKSTLKILIISKQKEVLVKKQPILLGAHMSIAGGIENAYLAAATIECTALQFFTHSNRQWAAKPLSEESIKKTITAQKQTHITHTIVHASYLINLASATPETRMKSKQLLELELKNCSDLTIPYLVLHPGSNPDLQEGIKLISEALNELQGSSPTTILLETMAGQGSQVGYRLEHLGAIREGCHHKSKVGYCADTCHLWASGYDFSDKKKYTAFWDEFDEILGIKQLKAFHMNDSKKERGTKVDRHAEIGEGTIPLEAFGLLMNDPRFSDIPKVLETPKDTLEDYAKNMKLLKSLLK
jgi:deoxyribonuclease IV